MKTYPAVWQDCLLWPILRAIWTPLTYGKISYWWQWRDWLAVPAQALEITDLETTAQERTNWLQSFWQTNFGWKKVAILQPKDRTVRGYRVGFCAGPKYSWGQICTIVVQRRCALLIGPGPVRFFGIAYPDSLEIALEVWHTTEKQFLPKNIPLL